MGERPGKFLILSFKTFLCACSKREKCIKSFSRDNAIVHFVTSADPTSKFYTEQITQVLHTLFPSCSINLIHPTAEDVLTC